MEIDLGLLIIFIVVWFSIYGGLHYYAYRKISKVLRSKKRVLAVVLVVLASSLFVVELLTHNGFVSLAYPLAGIAYSWMGLVFIFFFLSLFVDLVALLTKSKPSSKLRSALSSPRTKIVVASLSIIIAVIGYVSAKQVHIEKLELYSDKLVRNIRIVQISDLHLGILSNQKYIDKLVKAINTLEPDIIVSTGDLVDMQLDHIRELAQQLAALEARFGKYAVHGNHEAFAGLDQAIDVMALAGFELLSNRGVIIDGKLNLIGVDDPAVAGHFQDSDVNEDTILAGYDNGLFTVLLKHQPIVETSSVPLFDLQLSGHTHGGQIFPFGLLTRIIYPIGFGLTNLDNETSVYVSRGTGTWGPPIRVLAGPEVTLLEIRPTRSVE